MGPQTGLEPFCGAGGSWGAQRGRGLSARAGPNREGGGASPQKRNRHRGGGASAGGRGLITGAERMRGRGHGGAGPNQEVDERRGRGRKGGGVERGGVAGKWGRGLDLGRKGAGSEIKWGVVRKGGVVKAKRRLGQGWGRGQRERRKGAGPAKGWSQRGRSQWGGQDQNGVKRGRSLT